jgi:tetratricopeptide (TPR) repeat protein
MTAADHHAVAADLEAIASQLRQAIDAALVPEVRAYGTLRVGSDVHPWTADAEATWRAAEGPDPWRSHDLAVALHARAYDLEQEGSDEALAYWREALRYWSAVCKDDAIWELLLAGLGDTLGARAPASVIERTRARLPGDLLAVHEALVEDYRHHDRGRAREHMRILKTAPFDQAVIDAVRSRLIKPVLDDAVAAAHASRYEDAVSELEAWLFIDERNHELIRLLVYTLRGWNETVFQLEEFDRIRRNNEVAEAALDQLPAKARAHGGSLAAEAARMHFWRGLLAATEGSRQFDPESSASARRALPPLREGAKQLELAQRIDPEVVDDPNYGDVRRLQAEAEVVCGQCELVLEAGSAAQDHFRQAIRLNPDDPIGYLMLTAALLGPATVSREVLGDAERLLENARGKMRVDSDPRAPEFLEELEHRIATHRLFHGIQSGDRRQARLARERLMRMLEDEGEL